MRKTVLVISILLGILSCGKKKDTSFFVYSRFGAGDYILVEYEKKAGNLDSEIHRILSSVNSSVVAGNNQSLVSGINRNDSTGRMDADLLEIVKLSDRFYKESKGLFDPTSTVYEHFWGRELKKYIYQGKVDSASVDSLKRIAGWNKIRFNGTSITKLNASVLLDFKNIYRGYVVDKIVGMLKSYNLSNFKIEFGGRVYASGVNPSGKSWEVSIDEPGTNTKSRKILAFMSLNGESIVTAGSYRDYYSSLDKKLPYTIDPLTGYPVKHTLLSVTVVHPSCADADGYANAFLVMGPELTKAYLASHPDLKVYMISTNYKGEWVTYMSDSLREKVKMIKEELPI